MKKIGKTTRPFKYDNYTVDVTNIFKGLDLIDRVPEELWTEVHNTVQEAVIKTIPKKKKCKKAKWLSKGALQTAERRNTHLNAEFQREARRGKKAFLSDQCKEIEENNRMGKTRDLFSEEGNGNHSSILAWRIPGMEEPGGLPSVRFHRVRHD